MVYVNVLIDAESEKTMSVLVDNVETLVHFIDVDVVSQQVSVIIIIVIVITITIINSWPSRARLVVVTVGH